MKKKPAIGIEELVEFWTLLDDERELVDSRRSATKLGFALLLKFYSRYGWFPRGRVRRHLEHGQQGPDLGLAAATHDNRFGAAVEAGSVHAADRRDPAH